MQTNSLRDMRELTGNEIASVAGGVIGAIPGYSAPLPSSLFVMGSVCTTRDGVPGGSCANLYQGASGWMYFD